MSVFDLDEQGRKALDEQATLNPLDLSKVKPGFFDGLGTAFGSGIMRGGARAGTALSLAGAVQPILLDKAASFVTGENVDLASSFYFRNVVEGVGQNAVDAWTPDPTETGTAGRVLGGLAEIVLPLAAAGGNPSLLAATEGIERPASLVKEGVDAGTAGVVGTAGSVSTLVGFRLPAAFGTNLAQRLATGAGSNLLLGAGTSGVQYAALKAGGNDKQAKMYDPLDAEARTVDLLTGLAFGGIAHAMAPRVPLAQRDAVLTARNADRFQRAAGEGLAPTEAAAVSGQQALAQAMEQMARGEPVNVVDTIKASDFLPPTAARMTGTEAAAMIDRRITELSTLSTEGRLPKAELQQLRARDTEIRDVLRRENRLEREGVVRADPSSRPDVAALGQEQIEIRARLEAAQGTTAYAGELKRLQDRLARVDDDSQLIDLAMRLDGRQPATRYSEPPVKGGMTRLYHGSAIPGRYDGDAWFSTSREYAANYRGEGTELQYVDVPTDWVNGQLDPDGYGQTVDRGFTLNVELGSDFTGRRNPVTLMREGADAATSITGYPAFRRALESGGRADARNPESSALGVDQFTAGTWRRVVGRVKPAWAEGLSDAQILAARTDPAKSTEMVAALDAENAAGLAAAGLPVNTHTLYAAHHFGLSSAQRFARAGDSTPIEEIITPAQLAANGYLRGKSKGEVIANWDSRAKRAGVLPDGGMVDTNEAGQALRRRLVDDPDQLIRDYAALDDSDGGRTLNTDTARELSPEYLSDRTRSADVHEAASDTVKLMYERKLAQPTPEGFDNTVLFTAGGTGAGKTTGMRAMGDAIGRPEIVYDTNMNTLASAVDKIEKALAAGRNVDIVYVYRDPVEALTGGAIPRAQRQAEKFGTGRTVPLAEHAKTHVGVRPTIEAIAARYADDPRVHVAAIDNSRGKNKQQVVDLATLPRVEETTIHERLQAALEDARAGGLTEDLYRGFGGPGQGARPAVAGNRGGDQRPGQGAPRQPGKTGEVGPAESPVIAARQLAAEIPDASIVVGADADGDAVHRTIRDELADIEAEQLRATTDSTAYQAAVNCLLRRG